MPGVARGRKTILNFEKKSLFFFFNVTPREGTLGFSLIDLVNLVQTFGKLKLTYKYIYMSEELYYIDLLINNSEVF